MDLRRILHETFGFTDFRTNQEAVCQAAAQGEDVLLVMPTGAGKSLCYQLPAIARGNPALVISPLIALMDDQASKLQAIGLQVGRIHSGLSREDARNVCRRYLDGQLQYLFVAPERFRVAGFLEMLSRRPLGLIAVDEAHCISAWGHDFRPDYRALGEHLHRLRPAPVIALTATATPTVQQDIVRQLALRDPALFIHGFRRDNLQIETVELTRSQRTNFICAYLSQPERRPAIVYTPSRKATEEVAAALGSQCTAAAYHAGLAPDVRERVQRDFLSGSIQVVVATIAFGMGVDKPNVRTVLHYALPASVEAYYQEIGRAGRDGLPSRAILLYSFADRKIHDSFLDRDYPPLQDLDRVACALDGAPELPHQVAARLRLDPDHVQRVLERLAARGRVSFDNSGKVRAEPLDDWKDGYQEQLDFRRSQIGRMLDFAQTPQCRMTGLIRHFGDLADTARPCGHCDVCAPTAALTQSTRPATSSEQQQMRAILRLLVDCGGSRAVGRIFADSGLKERRTFDLLIEGLVRAAYLTVQVDTFRNTAGDILPFRKLCLTYEGKTLTALDPFDVLLRDPSAAANGAVPSARRTTRKKEQKLQAEQLLPEQAALAENLRTWRKAEAAKTGRPAFMVFSDAVLVAIAQHQPTTLPQLLALHGVGPGLTDRYGADICSLVRNGTPVSAIQFGAVRDRASHPLASPKQRVAPPLRESPASAPAKTQSQQTLEASLRAWRKKQSETIGMPAFFILGTSALHAIVTSPPSTLAELSRIDGLTPETITRFGSDLLALCAG